jgi:hypothetical protein
VSDAIALSKPSFRATFPNLLTQDEAGIRFRGMNDFRIDIEDAPDM